MDCRGACLRTWGVEVVLFGVNALHLIFQQATSPCFPLALFEFSKCCTWHLPINSSHQDVVTVVKNPRASAGSAPPGSAGSAPPGSAWGAPGLSWSAAAVQGAWRHQPAPSPAVQDMRDLALSSKSLKTRLFWVIRTC